MSVPEESHSRNVSCALKLYICVFISVLRFQTDFVSCHYEPLLTFLSWLDHLWLIL